jgi:hypothetical protein
MARTNVVIVTLLLLIATICASPNPVRAEACANAPRARLSAAMAAVVAPGIAGLNLRALPVVEAGIVARLYQGMALIVISGPSCNGGINWWRVEVDGGTRGWVAEGTWLRYYIIPADEADNPRDPLFVSCPPFAPRRCPLP